MAESRNNFHAGISFIIIIIAIIIIIIRNESIFARVVFARQRPIIMQQIVFPLPILLAHPSHNTPEL